MLILKSLVFKKNPEIIFGFSTKVGANREAPYFFNVSKSVGDDKKIVDENRLLFFNSLGMELNNIALQKQIHSDKIIYVTKGGVCGESDAMITDKINLGLAISTADCAAIFLYDKKRKIIAAVHSGWRGTKKRILHKTLLTLSNAFQSKPENILAYIAPSINQKNYEVGEEVAKHFENKYLIPSGKKYLLDVAQTNYDILINFGVKSYNIQASSLCSFEMNQLLHSYRRDGQQSGRAFGIIAMRN
ncbi:MAG: peptidoglycan editing factor PgeF [Bacteroidetes bacterium]|nr:peptidoglycan editing factor PgeF [Bacteroidota bacterium]